MLRRALALTAVAALAIFSLVQAQEAGQRRGRAREEGARQGQQGRQGGFAQMQERWTTSMKEQMGATDEEWRAIQPKLEKIMSIQRDMRTGFRGWRGSESDEPQTDVAKAMAGLRATVEDKNASSDTVSKRLTAFREARDKAREEVKTLQKELKEQVNPRQEAVLVLNGVLE